VRIVPISACVVFLTLVPRAGSGRASTRELALYAGPLTGEHNHTYSWSIDYTERIGRHFAGSFTWLNEGHIPNRHRDVLVVQLGAGFR
jgi:hypothetical protein